MKKLKLVLGDLLSIGVLLPGLLLGCGAKEGRNSSLPVVTDGAAPSEIKTLPEKPLKSLMQEGENGTTSLLLYQESLDAIPNLSVVAEGHLLNHESYYERSPSGGMPLKTDKMQEEPESFKVYSAEKNDGGTVWVASVSAALAKKINQKILSSMNDQIEYQNKQLCTEYDRKVLLSPNQAPTTIVINYWLCDANTEWCSASDTKETNPNLARIQKPVSEIENNKEFTCNQSKMSWQMKTQDFPRSVETFAIEVRGFNSANSVLRFQL